MAMADQDLWHVINSINTTEFHFIFSVCACGNMVWLISLHQIRCVTIIDHNGIFQCRWASLDDHFFTGIATPKSKYYHYQYLSFIYLAQIEMDT